MSAAYSYFRQTLRRSHRQVTVGKSRFAQSLSILACLPPGSRYQDSVQEMVRGVIEAYWNLVQARVDVWARMIQVQQPVP